jgi:glycosyltransferase involved in cell wall biosynthesis
MNDADRSSDLAGIRVLAALNGLELFGHERGNIEVFKALRQCGAELLVAVNERDEGGGVFAELHRLGFETFSLPFNPQWSLQFLRKHPQMLLTNPWAALRCSWRFRQAIRSFRPTHIHIGSPLAYSYVWLALMMCRVPLIYRLGDCPPVDSKFNLLIWKSAMRRTAVVVANSRFVLDRAVAAGARAETMQLIYSVAPARTEMRGNDDGPFDSERIVYVGAIAEHKGLIPLVDAVAALISDRPRLQVDLCGGSMWDADFRRRLVGHIRELGIEDHVHLHGQVDDPTPYYRRAAVHVVPSIWDEPSANVVFEAKREGVPSIVFPSGGLAELVHHQVDGYICGSKSADSLVEALRWMMGNEDRLSAMRAAARADYLARFGPERFARQWASVYRSALHDGRSA